DVVDDRAEVCLDDIWLQAEAPRQLTREVHVVANVAARVVRVRELGRRIGRVTGDGERTPLHQLPARLRSRRRASHRGGRLGVPLAARVRGGCARASACGEQQQHGGGDRDKTTGNYLRPARSRRGLQG